MYRERAEQVAADYPEVLQALDGEPASALRVDRNDALVLSVAVPVQRYRQVLGAVMQTAVGHRPRQAGRSKYTNLGRLLPAVSDLAGVMWLRARARDPGKITEAPAGPVTGSDRR